MFIYTCRHPLFLQLAWKPECSVTRSRSVDLNLPSSAVCSDLEWITDTAEVLVPLVLQASGVPGVVALLRSASSVTLGCHMKTVIFYSMKNIRKHWLRQEVLLELESERGSLGLEMLWVKDPRGQFANQRGREGSVWKGKRRMVWSEIGLDTCLGTVSRAPRLALGFWRYTGEGDECFSAEGLALGLRSGLVLCGTKLPVQISHKISSVCLGGWEEGRKSVCLRITCCSRTSRPTVLLDAGNGRPLNLEPLVKAGFPFHTTFVPSPWLSPPGGHPQGRFLFPCLCRPLPS